jgi:hypothetical protein
MQILLQAIWFVASPANAAANMFVLEPFGLREARWVASAKLQEPKILAKGRGNIKTRPLGFSERPRSAALLAHNFSPLPVPTGGSDFSLNHRPLVTGDEFDPSLLALRSVCNSYRTGANVFSKAVARLQQYLPDFLAEPKNTPCRNYG